MRSRRAQKSSLKADLRDCLVAECPREICCLNLARTKSSVDVALIQELALIARMMLSMGECLILLSILFLLREAYKGWAQGLIR